MSLYGCPRPVGLLVLDRQTDRHIFLSLVGHKSQLVSVRAVYFLLQARRLPAGGVVVVLRIGLGQPNVQHLRVVSRSESRHGQSLSGLYLHAHRVRFGEVCRLAHHGLFAVVVHIFHIFIIVRCPHRVRRRAVARPFEPAHHKVLRAFERRARTVFPCVRHKQVARVGSPQRRRHRVPSVGGQRGIHVGLIIFQILLSEHLRSRTELNLLAHIGVIMHILRVEQIAFHVGHDGRIFHLVAPHSAFGQYRHGAL